MFTATELAYALASGAVTSEEISRELLARLEAEAALNAVVAWDRGWLLAAARLADLERREGMTRGPLHGVPITLKDSHSVGGMVTTCGHPSLSTHVPTQDGTVAARLRSAGALIFGKTNVPPFCSSYESENPVYGRTLHPRDPARTPGGSSGGAAAALSAGHTYLDVGSDFSGSARIPAHYCGVYAFKPTERRVSNYGHIPPLPGQPMHTRVMVSNGAPMARSLEDVELLFGLIQGPDGLDTEVPPIPYRREATPELPSLRIAVLAELGGIRTSRSVVRCIDRLGAALAQAGAHVERSDLPIDLVELNTKRKAIQSFAFGALNAWNGQATTQTYSDYAWALGGAG